MDRRKFNKNNFTKDPLHWTAANDWPKEVRKCLEKGENPYRPNKDGLTPMHAAVAANAPGAARVLLEQYQSDFAIVKEHMRQRFLWKTENSCWNKRPILIAWTEEECKQVQLAAAACPAAIPFNIQIFVLLKFASDGNRLVALDVCSAGKRTAVLRCLPQLTANGVLSLDNSDLRRDCLTYLQTACLYGHANMITLLLSHGAQLSAVGDGGSIPLLTACSTMKKNIVKLLLTTHVNRYDPTVCDNEGRNAFHILLQKNDREMVEYVLPAMIKYRQTQYGETESEAFNKIFPYEYEEYNYTTTWSFVRANMKELCSKYVVQYGIDLTYNWRGNTNVLHLITRQVNLDYCFEGIRNNPDILKLGSHSEMNVLQALLENDHLEFIQKLYEEKPAVKHTFESVGAFTLLQNTLAKRKMKLLSFMLEHHSEYFRSIPDKLVEYAISHTWFDRLVYREAFTMLSEVFPEMKDKIDETLSQVAKRQRILSFSDRFNELRNNFEQTITKLKAENIHMNELMDEQNRNVLHEAVDWDDKQLVGKLLDTDNDLNRRDNEGNLPIFSVRNSEMFDLLYAKMPVDPSIINDNGYNLFHRSCNKGYSNGEALLTKLLSLGFDVNQPTGDGNVPLTLASCCSTVKFLLEHGAQLELINGDALGKTLSGKQRCAAWALLPKIAHFDGFAGMAHVYLPWMLGSQNRDFFTCSVGHYLEDYPDIRKTLFDSLYRHSHDEAEDFFRTVCSRAINICARWFLDYGYEIDFDSCDKDEYTPLLGLLSYMEEPNLDVVERLLKKGVNVNARNNWGRNSLLALVSHFRSAKWYGHTIQSIELLLDYGADINAQDVDGNTALHYAFEYTELELVELLVTRGADRKLKNNENKLAYQKSDKNMQALYAFLG